MLRLPSLTLALGFFVIGIAPAVAAQPPNHLKLYTVKGDFDTVKEDLSIAITNQGLVLDHTSHIGAMLERTGKDLGADKKIYDKAESLQFCSARVSRGTMEADPTNIVFCPYIIVIYTLAQDPKTVHVGYRRPQPVGTPASRAAIKEIEKLLDGIVKEAVNVK